MSDKTNLYAYLIAILMLSFGLSAGAMEEKTKLGQRLIDAAAFDELKKVKALIKSNAPINEKDAFGRTALMWAAEKGFASCCETLLEHGASINEVDMEGWTALMHAARWGRQSCCETLLKFGASVNEKNKKGMTVLQLAGWYETLSCCELIIEVMLGIHPFYTEEASATLFCMKEIQPRDDDKIFLDLREPIAQRLCFIAQEMDKEAVLAEVNKITNERIKQALIKKYFSENEKSV